MATIQELCAGRLRLGVGVGWRRAEFRALGVDRRRRGALGDETLAFLAACFAGDEVEAHGQRFLFRPRPPRPPILVGGAGPHALARAVRHGDGWMPMGTAPDALAGPAAELQQRAEEAGRAPLQVVALTHLALARPDEAARQVDAYAAAGATGLVHADRDPTRFGANAERLGALMRRRSGA